MFNKNDKFNSGGEDDNSRREGKEGESYKLYTEKVIVNPFVKYKKIMNVFKFVMAAVVFGLIASFVMAVTYPWLIEQRDKEAAKKALEFTKDEYPTENMGTEIKVTEADRENIDEKETLEQQMSYTEVIEKVKKSVVTITNGSGGLSEAVGAEERVKATVGVVIGELDNRYIILTNNNVVSSFEEKYVVISDNTEIKAEFISSDTETNMALINIAVENIPLDERSDIDIAELDNSYAVKQGDAFVVLGRLYGKTKSADQGYVTGIMSESGTDNTFGIIDTGIRALFDDYCFLFNMKGNIIGVSRAIEESTTLKANGISDLKSMIEKLSAGTEIVYLGIKGTNVTTSMAIKYALPYGIYIKEVALDSPAFRAGIQAGDVVTVFNNDPVLTIQSFSERLYRCSNGDEVTITVKRPGVREYKELTFTAKLSVR